MTLKELRASDLGSVVIAKDTKESMLLPIRHPDRNFVDLVLHSPMLEAMANEMDEPDRWEWFLKRAAWRDRIERDEASA